MVIFHSYVSLPEGNQPNIQIWLRHNVSSWFVRTPSPSNNSCSLFKAGCQKTPRQKKYDPAFKKWLHMATAEIQLTVFLLMNLWYL